MRPGRELDLSVAPELAVDLLLRHDSFDAIHGMIIELVQLTSARVTAATVGWTCSRTERNISRVSVLVSPRAMNSATTTSSSDDRNAKTADTTMLVRIWGSVTVRKARRRVAPRLRAAIS